MTPVRDFIIRSLSQTGLGMMAVWLSCVGAFLIGGEFPYKESAGAWISAIYAVTIIHFGKWKWPDTIENAVFFVAYGVFGTLAAFHEESIGSPIVVFDIISPLPFFGTFLSHLIWGSIARLKP